MISHILDIPVPILEKILRPLLVYFFLILMLRLFGKRELAQLNPFDLIVLLMLSNTVQNAIIGEDNSVTGGIIGAFSLLAINWIVIKLLFRLPRVNEALEGDEVVLIRDGRIDKEALRRETLTELELLSVLHKQGLDDVSEVEKCTLEPNGTFYVESKKPSSEVSQIAGLRDSVEALTAEVRLMRAQLAGQ